MKTLFFMLIVFSMLGFTQEPGVKSLKQQLAEEKSDSVKVKVLNLIATHYIERYPDSSEYYSNQALALSETIPYDKGIIESLKIFGKARERQGKYYILRSLLIRNVAIGTLILTFLSGAAFFYLQKKNRAKDKKLLDQHNSILSIEASNRELREKYLQEKLDFKNKELATNTLNLIQKNGIMTEIRESIQEILATSKDSNIKFGRLIKLIDYSFSLDKDWDEFKTYFDQVHTEFFARLKAKYPELSTADFRLCALIKLKLSMKESATILGISAESVKTARYRLRKKLNLNSEENLLDFITTF